MLVQNRGEYVRHSGGVRLIPGVNNISDEQWQQFSAHPLSQALIDAGEIVPQEIAGKPRTLADMNAGEAAALIKDTHDLALLAELEEEEKAGNNRKGVLDVIGKQMDAIEKEIEEARKKQQEGGE